MVALAVVIALGAAIGLARGGSLGNLGRTRLRGAPLVYAGLALQAAAQIVPESNGLTAYALVVASYAALLAFGALQIRRPGMGLVLAGASANYLVILLNGGMPISPEAAARAGYAGDAARTLLLRGKHVIDAGEAHLRWLADVIPLPGNPSVASIGDLVLWAGLVIVIQRIVAGPSGRHAGGSLAGEDGLGPNDAFAPIRADRSISSRSSRSAHPSHTVPSLSEVR